MLVLMQASCACDVFTCGLGSVPNYTHLVWSLLNRDPVMVMAAMISAHSQHYKTHSEQKGMFATLNH